MQNILHRKFFEKILYFLTHKATHVLVWVSLALLMVISFTEFTHTTDFQTVAGGFFSAIAFVIGLASVTFTYSTTKPAESRHRESLVLAGEMFLYSALIIVIALLIGWFTFQASAFFSLFSWGTYAKILLGLLLFVSQFSLVFAADFLSRGIRILERDLSLHISRSKR